jgi:hypothetical protein
MSIRFDSCRLPLCKGLTQDQRCICAVSPLYLQPKGAVESAMVVIRDRLPAACQLAITLSCVSAAAGNLLGCPGGVAV